MAHFSDKCSAWIVQAAATKEVGKVLARTRNHADAFRESADQLYYLNQELQSCCVPAHDVHTARQVLETGTASCCSQHFAGSVHVLHIMFTLRARC